MSISINEWLDLKIKLATAEARAAELQGKNERARKLLREVIEAIEFDELGLSGLRKLIKAELSD